ncbi:hypothetical protein PO909_023347 [Leuciscus waleckii]
MQTSREKQLQCFAMLVSPKSSPGKPSMSLLSPCSLQPNPSNAKDLCFPWMWILQNMGETNAETTREPMAGHLLMSSALNHRTAEWFYAYFICISLNR